MYSKLHFGTTSDIINTGGSGSEECPPVTIYDDGSKPEHVELEPIRIWLN